MNTTTEYAYAKINLGLDIVGKRSDGYHLLRMVMQTLKLHDVIRVTCRDEDSGIKTCTAGGKVKDDTDNLAYRAAFLLKEKYGIKQGIEINIEKNIPVAAGLAGGSSDAAAVLRAVNRLFSLGLDVEDLKKHGVLLGADVPYCIEGGTRLSEGIGEMLTPVRSLKECGVLLIKPDRGISTKEAYSDYDNCGNGVHPDIEAIISAVEEGNIPLLGRVMGNVLEKPSLKKVREIAGIKDFLLNKRLMAVMMSGSGPTVFAMDEDRDILEKAFHEGKDRFPDFEVILTEVYCP